MTRLIFLALLVAACLIRLAYLMNHPAQTCEQVEAVTGGELAWGGYPPSWRLPANMTLVAAYRFPDGGGLWRMYSETEGAYYVLRRLKRRGHDGKAVYCGPYRVPTP